MCQSNPSSCVENNLDVQYITAISKGSHTTIWRDRGTWASWLLSVANAPSIPMVISISWGVPEMYVTASDMDSFAFTAKQLALQGVTIIVSSGDDGVANIQATNAPQMCGYAPDFPSSCPYVTSVGATQGVESGSQEVVCQSDLGGQITSGGGLSNFFPLPSWQANAVNGYFSSIKGTPNAAYPGYNPNDRAYPDISAAGYGFPAIVGGQTMMVSGTSASAPVVAGMISLANSVRLAAGKSTLGWINPLLYSLGSNVFNDITSGSNNCVKTGTCCPQGFQATTGWDPITG